MIKQTKFFVTLLSAMLQFSPAAIGVPAPRATWQTEQWMAQDVDYKKIRTLLDASTGSKKETASVVQSYEMEFRTQKYDLARLYKYAYASFKAMQNDPVYRASGKFAEVVNLINDMPLRQSYELDRLHFLVEAEDAPGPALKQIGFRLLKHDPRDDQVKYFVVETLEPGTSQSEKILGLKYAKELLNSSPSNPKFIALLGFMYDLSFLSHHNKPDAIHMILLYKKYLAQAPKDASFRAPAAQRIKYAQAWLDASK